jgi:hypothetical protein
MKRMKHLGAMVALGALVVTGLLASPASADQTVITPNGTWYAHPGQSTTYQTSVQQPINADGSSNFKANGKAVIPVKLGLSQGTGDFVFESVPGVAGRSAYSFLEFDPTTAPTLAQVTQLIANYAFTTGDCQAGSLRWTLYLNDGGTYRNLDIHYQPGAGGISQQFCAAGTSGHNMADLTSTDPYVVIQEFTHAPYTFTSSYNVTYSEAVAQLGTLPVAGMNLIVDSGTLTKPEVVNLASATVGVGGGSAYSETFTPQAGSPQSSVCPTQQATIKITKVDGSPIGAVNEPITIQPQDNDGIFRIVDCKYMYNLATSSLTGVGTYKVYAEINGVTASNPAVFDLK